MPAGISNAKARRNSKTKNGPSRAKAGLPAKAGKRRPHNIKSDGKGNYLMAEYKPRPKVEFVVKRGYEMGEVKEATITKAPTGSALYDGLMKIDQMERRMGSNMSDPFAFKRMRCHFRLGLVEV